MPCAFSAFFFIIMTGFFPVFFYKLSWVIQWIPTEKFISSTFLLCVYCIYVGSQEFIFTNFHFRKRSVALRHYKLHILIEPDHVQMTNVNCRLKVNCTRIYKNIFQFNLSRCARRLKFRQNDVIISTSFC